MNQQYRIPTLTSRQAHILRLSRSATIRYWRRWRSGRRWSAAIFQADVNQLANRDAEVGTINGRSPRRRRAVG
jgi:hypothetical protein